MCIGIENSLPRVPKMPAPQWSLTNVQLPLRTYFSLLKTMVAKELILGADSDILSFIRPFPPMRASILEAVQNPSPKYPLSLFRQLLAACIVPFPHFVHIHSPSGAWSLKHPTPSVSPVSENRIMPPIVDSRIIEAKRTTLRQHKEDWIRSKADL